MTALPSHHSLWRRRLYHARASANEEAGVTAGSPPLAVVARLKPEWTVLLELLVRHFSGIIESSGETEMV